MNKKRIGIFIALLAMVGAQGAKCHQSENQ